jgi:hypothetical protein
MLIHGGLTFRVYLEKKSKDEKKNDSKKQRMKAYEGLKLFLALMTL